MRDLRGRDWNGAASSGLKLKEARSDSLLRPPGKYAPANVGSVDWYQISECKINCKRLVLY
jgi:hypothetical protein